MSKMEDMQSYFDEYPEALRKARASSSLTLAELARISGVPYNSICSVNSGATKQPLLYYSAATCKALGLTDLYIKVVQFLQEAVPCEAFELREIVLQIILNGVLCCFR